MGSHPDPAPNDEPCWLCPAARAAFTALYRQHRAAVFRYFYHQIGHVQDAEDLTATTFCTAVSRFAQYRPEQAVLAAWLFGVAHNCFREYRRRRRSVDRWSRYWTFWMHSRCACSRFLTPPTVLARWVGSFVAH